MATINDPTTAADIARVGEAASYKPIHTLRGPIPGNWYRYSGFTGTIGAALAASSEVLQFRFVSGTKTYCHVYKVQLEGIGIVAVSTAIGPLGFDLIPARAWTAAGSGGTRIDVTGDNLQMATGETNSQVNDLGIATTGALTAGTKTLDANAVGGMLSGVLTGAATVQQTGPLATPIPLFDADGEGQMPLQLGNQEGFVVRTSHVGPAGLTYVARFKVVWVETNTPII
jgi:hypothetical protein